MNAEAIQDAELVKRFTGGDETAFAELMSRHQRRIFTAAMGLLHNPADAEEITQDTFVRAHRALARFRGDSSVATWLHRIAINLARNRYWHFFRRCRHTTLSLDAPLGTEGESTFSDLLSTAEPDPSQESSRNEFVNAVETCMERLEPSHRRILTMRAVLDQSYEDIAAALGINVGTVKSRIARARERLRTRLAEVCPEFCRENNPADWFEPARGSGRARVAGCRPESRAAASPGRRDTGQPGLSPRNRARVPIAGAVLTPRRTLRETIPRRPRSRSAFMSTCPTSSVPSSTGSA
jgi:RNA polymerase sigma-70 factor (ECF subfamily)